MMWQWGVASKCSPPPPKFNWIGLLPIQLNLFSTTHIKYSLNAYKNNKQNLNNSISYIRKIPKQNNYLIFIFEDYLILNNQIGKS